MRDKKEKDEGKEQKEFKHEFNGQDAGKRVCTVIILPLVFAVLDFALSPCIIPFSNEEQDGIQMP